MFPSNSIVVLYANKTDTTLVETFGESFTCKINNKGPSIDPWETPHDTVSMSELVFCPFTYCFLLVK